MGKSHNGSWYGRKHLEMILLALMCFFLTLEHGKGKRYKDYKGFLQSRVPRDLSIYWPVYSRTKII